MAGEGIERERGCSRAREWASLCADGQLSELERLLLRRHLARCPSCRAFADELTFATRLIRDTPLEQPSRRLQPAARPARSRRPRYRLAFATALLALTATAGGLLGSFLGGGSSQSPAPIPAPTEVAVVPQTGTTPLPQVPAEPSGGNV